MTTFNAGPVTAEEVKALAFEGTAVPQDWAHSLTEISKAVRSLEDALPTGKADVIVEAFGSLRFHSIELEAFLKLRKLDV